MKTDDEPWIADASVAFLNDLVLYNGDVGMVRECLAACRTSPRTTRRMMWCWILIVASLWYVERRRRRGALRYHWVIEFGDERECHARLMEDKACVDVLVDWRAVGNASDARR